MKNQMNVIVDGKTYNVEVGDLSSHPVEVVVNGKTYLVQLATQGSIRQMSPEVKIETPLKPVVSEVKQPARVAQASPAAGNDIRSPLPGIIHDVVVKPGDSITAKQQVCTLEAMKMKSAIRSARDGVVAAVEVTNGMKVAHNQIIIRFE